MRAIFTILIALAPVLAPAQDVVSKKDGQNIKAKVIEVTPEEVKYKRFEYQDGPTYTVKKSEIISIAYANGETEDFKIESNSGKRMFILAPSEKKIELPTLNIMEGASIFIADNRPAPPKKSQVEFSSSELVTFIKKSLSENSKSVLNFVDDRSKLPASHYVIVSIEAYDATFYPGAWHGQVRYFVEVKQTDESIKREIETTKGAFNALGKANIRGVLTRSFEESTSQLIDFLNKSLPR